MADTRDDEVRRLSDRTVDNLRGLYSVLFALSFGLALTGTYEKVHAALVGQAFDPIGFWVHVLVSLSFLVTLGLFHYQTDRYLDVVYRRDGLPGVRPLVFLLDLVRGLVSMAPIYLMAQSLGAEALPPGRLHLVCPRRRPLPAFQHPFPVLDEPAPARVRRWG